MPKLATKRTCTGCLACIDSCPFKALFLKYSKNGFMYPEVTQALCTECKICEKICPIINPDTNTNTYKDVKPFAAWSLDNNLRKKSTSGGIFAQLALDTITQFNGIVIGAALINNRVKHIAIDNVKDLPKLQGSKYLQSETTGIYAYTKGILKNGRTVLFSGTPCQIEGLYSYLGRNTNYSNLFTCEVICHGVPSTLLMEYNIKKNSISKIISFRDKVNGWKKGSAAMTYISKDNVKIRLAPKDHDFFLNSFGRDLCLRSSCYECSFCQFPRVADLSLADYWGIKDWQEQWDLGVSLVLVNNERGYNLLLKNKNIVTYLTKWEVCLKKNPRIFTGNNFHKFISLSNKISFILNKFSHQTAYFLFSARISNRNFLWLPYKLLVKSIGLLVKIHNKKIMFKTIKKLRG